MIKIKESIENDREQWKTDHRCGCGWSHWTSLASRNGRTNQLLQWSVQRASEELIKKSRAHQGMRYPNVTWRIYRLIWLLIYHSTTHMYFRSGIFFLSKAHVLRTYNGRRITKSALHIFPGYNFSINYYIVRSLPIHKICVLCGIYCITQFLCYRRRKTPTTLKSGFQMGQGHGKLRQWIPRVSLPINH